MKRAIVYFIVAIFLLLVVQPNINSNLNDSKNRVPENTTSNITTNGNASISQASSGATICIDAANGGQDTGYTVNEETYEKDINLTFALNLGKALEKAGYKVVYTRTDDNIETSSDENDSAKMRINSAIDQKADYFISIQMNDDENKLAQGYSIFTQPDEKMIELSQAVSASLEALHYSTFNGSDSDHYANFPILQDKELPSILLELGYLTNHEDLAKLMDESFQTKIVYAITEAFVEVID